jgi:hypothetical protein
MFSARREIPEKPIRETRGRSSETSATIEILKLISPIRLVTRWRNLPRALRDLATAEKQIGYSARVDRSNLRRMKNHPAPCPSSVSAIAQPKL